MVCARENRIDLVGTLATVKIRILLLALLVMLAMLVSHAAVGSSRLMALDPVTATVTHQSPDIVEAAASYVAEHSPSHTYYYVAALCTLLLGSFAGLIFGGNRRQWNPVLSPRIRRSSAPAVLYGGMRPTPPLLQVFRL